MPKKNNATLVNAFNRLSSMYRLLICLCAAILFYFLFPSYHMNSFTHILFAWDIFSLCMIILSWLTFFTTGPHRMREMAQLQDESRTIIFIILLISTITSLLAVLLLLTSKDAVKLNKEVAVIVAITGMVFSWVLVHTTFTLRYAHLF